MTIIFISLVWFAALAALVACLATRPYRVSAGWERSPRLLQDEPASFEEAIGGVLQVKPKAKSSKPAATEHVRDRAHEDLYVRP
jgi:hypothetical protein